MNNTAKIIDDKQSTLFRIGAVSRITNIPVDTLRIWERRYSVVVPIRSDKSDRLYRRDDINRLTLLKMLVDRGHAIGSIAKLCNEDLTKRLELHNSNSTNANQKMKDKTIHVVMIGDVLSLQLEHNQIDDTSFCFTGLYRSPTEFIEKNQDNTIDILIVEYPAIQEDHIKSINELFKKSGAKKLILIYGFTNSAAKKLLQKTDYIFIHAPITVEHLHAEIKHLIEVENLYKKELDNVDVKGKAPLRTYSNKQLINLSSQSTTIKCECPQHLSSMILKMVQFEVYSTECENRNRKDAELHALLGNMTGHARSIMEQALTRIVEAEKLSVK